MVGDTGEAWRVGGTVLDGETGKGLGRGCRQTRRQGGERSLRGHHLRWGDKEDLEWRPERAEGEHGPLYLRKTPLRTLA